MPTSYPPATDPLFQANTFQQTRWSLVKRAAYQAQDSDPGMGEFCRIYWYPLYAAARRMGLTTEDACDCVQTLFGRLLARNTLQKADPARGRLRSWLLTILEHQIRDGVRAARAQKRGGGRPPFELDSVSAEVAYQLDPALQDDPAVSYRRRLAAVLLDESVEALAAFYLSSGRGELFDALLPALEGPLPDCTYDDVALRLGTTSGALRMAVFRLRERFRKTLRQKAAMALGVLDDQELDQELRDLFSSTP